jgi:hypothetical protein
MTNNLGACINRKDLCTVVTPTLIEDAISAVEYAWDNGWKEKEDAEKLKTSIEKIGNICGIVRHK